MTKYKYLKQHELMKEGDEYQLARNYPWKEIYPEWIGKQKDDVFHFISKVRRLREKNNII